MSSHTPSLIALSGLLIACGGKAEETPSLFQPLDHSGPVGVELAPAVGAGTVRVPVRLVNDYGVAVSGGDVTVQVAGLTATLADPIVRIGASGYGYAEVLTTGPEVFTLSVTAAEDPISAEGEAQAWSTASPRQAYQMGRGTLPEVEGTPTFSAAGTGGMAWATGPYIYWQPAAPGHPGHRVAQLASDVTGMVSAHVDADGVLDLVAWAGNEIVLLRGVPEGGYGWGGSWGASNAQVAGLAVRDLNGDRLADLAVAVNQELEGRIEMLFGDGLWSFEAGVPEVMTNNLMGISAADRLRDGQADISTLSAATGTVRRYTLADEGWVGAASFELSGYYAALGATLLPEVDMNNDGSEEIIIQGAPGGSTQDLVFYTIGEVPTHYPLSFGAYSAAVADFDGDGAYDIVAHEAGEMHLIRFADGGFIARAYDNAGPAGPVAGGDMDGDGLGDVGVAEATMLSQYPGRLNTEGEWNPVNDGWYSIYTQLDGPALYTDFDGDGVIDLGGFVLDEGSGDLAFQAWTWNPSGGEEGTGEASMIGNIDVGTGVVGHAVMRCDDRYFALVGSASDSTVFRFALSGSGDTLSLNSADSAATNGTLLDCGLISSGEEGVIVAATAGSWSMYSSNLGLRDSGELGATADVALVDSDGDGLGEAVGCSGDGCSVIGHDFDGDGVEELVRSSGSIELTWGGTTTTMVGAGQLSVADADGDGVEDLIALDAAQGRIQIYRALQNGLAPAAVLHTWRGIAGDPAFGDLTGDGLWELLFRDTSGDSQRSPPSTATPTW
jgi:hypothetical protein